MARFAIFLDGEMTPTPRLEQLVSGCRIIAADGGIRHASALGLEPELWLGDFDSTPGGLREAFTHVEQTAYPEDKDSTDGEIAIEEALERGATELLLIGAFGGNRADHALLHKTKALALAGDGIPVVLSDGSQEGYPVLEGAHEFNFEHGTLFSLIGFSALSKLTISGVKWPLDAIDLPLGSSLTLSNVVTGTLGIRLGAGKALLIAQVQI